MEVDCNMCPEVVDMFKSLEVDRKDILGTKQAGSDDRIEDYGPHLIRLPQSARADQIALTPFQALAWRTLGRKVKNNGKSYPELGEKLLKAHIRIRPDEFVATCMMSAIIGSVVGVVAGIVLIIVMGIIGMGTMGMMFGPLLMFILPVGIYYGMLGSPRGKAKKRGKDIDINIANAMSFISALSSADVNIDVIFKELSKQEIYGEVKGESEWITRDTELLGMDIQTAIRLAASRTPSQRFQDFLQGVITTTSAGGKLKPFFIMKSEQYQADERMDLKARVETLGMLAESYVTVGVAFPLFLVVMMAIMALVGSSPDFIVMMLYVIAFGMIPGTQVGFIVGIQAVSEG